MVEVVGQCSEALNRRKGVEVQNLIEIFAGHILIGLFLLCGFPLSPPKNKF